MKYPLFSDNRKEKLILFPHCSVHRTKILRLLRVVYAESKPGLLDEYWARGVGKVLKVKAACSVRCEDLRDDFRRESLMALRAALEERRLELPNKYPAIANELLVFSFKAPSEGWVQALAFASKNENSCCCCSRKISRNNNFLFEG